MKKNSLKVFTLVTSLLFIAGCSSNSDAGTPSVHVHQFADEWSYNSGHHWHACICGAESDYEAHHLNDWVIDKEATIYEEGLKHRSCEICDYYIEVIIDKLTPSNIERVYVATDTGSMLQGNTRTITAVTFPNDEENNLKYISSDDSILSVEDGIMSGNKAGTALITVYNDNNKNNVFDDNEPFAYLSYTVNARDSSKSVSLSESYLELKVDEEVELTITKKNITSSYYSYYVEHPELVSIVPTGKNTNRVKVKGLRKGESYVSVSCDSYDGRCTVLVTDNVDSKGLRAEAVEFGEKSIVVNVGDTFTPGVNVLPYGAIDDYSLMSKDPSLLITDKSVTACRAGTFILTAKTENDKETTTRIVVKDNFQSESIYYNNYYGDLTWENSEDLKTKLHTIISTGKNNLRFESSPTNWESNSNADEYIYDSAYVDTVYSSNPVLKTQTTTGWQREHVFAASLMTGLDTDVSTDNYNNSPIMPRATDFHNLYAGSTSGNTSRGKKNFGYANKNSDSYTEMDDYSYDKYNFEPSNEDKGRIARAIFYMGVMYNQDEVARITESGKTFDITTKGLVITEDVVALSNSKLSDFLTPSGDNEIAFVNAYKDYVSTLDPELEGDELTVAAYQYYRNECSPYAIGNLSDLLEWNSYGVDFKEMQHNNSVYSYNCSAGGGVQGNRNPFVDYPELVEYIYGSLKDTAGSIKNLTPSVELLDITDNNEIHHYQKDSTKYIDFNVGDAFDPSECYISGITNDFRKVEPDYSLFEYEEHTFTDADVDSGWDTVIETPANDVPVHVNVIDSGLAGHGGNYLEDCNYYYIPKYKKGIDDLSESKNVTAITATLGSHIFDVSFKNTVSITNSNTGTSDADGHGGIKIGTGTAAAGEATFISQDIFEEVHAVYFNASAASQKTYTYKIYIGDETTPSFTGTIEGNTQNKCGGKVPGKKTGKVKIVITGITAALVIDGIGINTYDK